ncbi:MAG: response regulator, partial [Candidatus Muiribacteriota bacterium]
MKKVEKLDRKNILIVDDNKENRFLMKILLKKHGAVIDEAVNGKEAIDKILAKQYDVILMDIQMPIMDGYEATIKIREMEKNK